jgi:hypothetical protein
LRSAFANISNFQPSFLEKTGTAVLLCTSVHHLALQKAFSASTPPHQPSHFYTTDRREAVQGANTVSKLTLQESQNRSSPPYIEILLRQQKPYSCDLDASRDRLGAKLQWGAEPWYPNKYLLTSPSL